jgi:palmitoyl-protein thioesterase
VLFAQDKTVVPKESSWFGSEAISDTTHHARPLDDAADHDSEGAQTPLVAAAAGLPGWPGADPPTIVPMRLQPLYAEDWIGLRALDERGGVHLESCPGEHMQLSDDCWEWIVRKYCGGAVEVL